MKETLYKKLRKRFSLEQKDTNYLTREEMMQIVTQIYGQEQPWTRNLTYMTDYLNDRGWTKQVTTDTHPTRQNLNWLLNTPLFGKSKKKQPAKTKEKVTLSEILQGIDSKLMEKAKGISINKESTRVTIEF